MAAESIVFAVDVDPEVNQEVVTGSTRLDVIRQCISFFVASKRKVNSGHLFGIATLEDKAALLGHGLTGSPEELDATAQKLHARACGQFDLGSLVTLVASLGKAVPPVRIVLMYCRSRAPPVWSSCRGMGAPVDVLYVHERPTEGVNSPQEVYNVLEELADALSKAAGHNAYIFEASAQNSRKICSLMVWLMAHPSSRPPQQQLSPAAPDLALQPFLPTAATATTTAATTASTAGATPTPMSPPISGYLSGGGGSAGYGSSPGSASNASSTSPGATAVMAMTSPVGAPVAPPPGATMLGPFTSAAEAAAAAASLHSAGSGPKQ